MNTNFKAYNLNPWIKRKKTKKKVMKIVKIVKISQI